MVLSSDLTAASDTLPLDLIKRFVDGIVDGIKAKTGSIPAWAEQTLRELTGPQTLVYPDGRTILRTSRGILMGLPLTWFFLSLTH
jgi:hypothetical protein